MRIVNKYVYKIMLATYKPHSYNEIKKDYKLNSRSLSSWLAYLNQCGLIDREVKEKPIRCMYKLTPKGKKILEHVIEIVDCEPKLTKEGWV